MKEDMAREVDCPSNPSESPAGSPHAGSPTAGSPSASSPAQTSQPCTSPQPSSQPSVPICDVTSQLSTLTQRLSASEAEAQLWKSRAMKLKTSATSTPAKSSSSEAAYDELAKEAQGMNEKIHVLTGRVRALNKEKADLVKEKEKLEETITKVKEEKVKGVQGSKKETEALVRSEMESLMSSQKSEHAALIAKLKESHSSELASLNLAVSDLTNKMDASKKQRIALEVKYDAVCIEKGNVEQTWIAKLRDKEREAREMERTPTVVVRNDGRREEEKKRREGAEAQVRKLESDLIVERKKVEDCRADLHASLTECKALKREVVSFERLRSSLSIAEEELGAVRKEKLGMKEKQEKTVRELNKKYIESEIGWEEERKRLEGMIEGLEREIGKLRQRKDVEKEKEKSRSASHAQQASDSLLSSRETQGLRILEPTAAGGQPSFAANVQMKSQIDRLTEENRFMKEELEALREKSEGDAVVIARAMEEREELEGLREEVGGLREEVGDGRDAIKEIREMYRLEIKRLLGESSSDPSDAANSPTPNNKTPLNAELYSPAPETPKRKPGLKAGLKGFFQSVKTPRVEGNQEDWNPWEL